MPARGAACMIAAAVVATFALASAPLPKADAQAFASDMAVAMNRMQHDMMVPASGDPDRDFAAMMIPHHQGAIDMAKVQLRYGRDAALRRLAQKVIIEQGQEISIMQRFVDQHPATARGKPSNAATRNGNH